MPPLAFVTEPHPAPTPPQKRAAVLADPGFGRVFTEHMVTLRYREGRGWHDAKITARAPLTMDPAAAVLHYSQQIFEGLKAYRTADVGTIMFRPAANAQRFRRSAERLAMPVLPETVFVEACDRLVKTDREPTAARRCPQNGTDTRARWSHCFVLNRQTISLTRQISRATRQKTVSIVHQISG